MHYGTSLMRKKSERDRVAPTWRCYLVAVSLSVVVINTLVNWRLLLPLLAHTLVVQRVYVNDHVAPPPLQGYLNPPDFPMTMTTRKSLRRLVNDAVQLSSHDQYAGLNDTFQQERGKQQLDYPPHPRKNDKGNNKDWRPSDEWLHQCIQEQEEDVEYVQRVYTAQWLKYQLGDCLKQCKSCETSIGSSSVGNLSIAGEYWNHVCQGQAYFSNVTNITFLSDLFRRYTRDPHPYETPWPRPANDEVVIHLRIGDIIDRPKFSGNSTLFQMLRHGADTRHGVNSLYPHGIKSVDEYLSTIQETGLQKVVLRGGSHFAAIYPKSRVFTACLTKAIREAGYNLTSVQVDGEDNPDHDFYYMAHARHFVMATGGYSRFIARLVVQSGGKVVGRLPTTIPSPNSTTTNDTTAIYNDARQSDSQVKQTSYFSNSTQAS